MGVVALEIMNVEGNSLIRFLKSNSLGHNLYTREYTKSEQFNEFGRMIYQ